jgi:hypothetical protein
MSCFRKIKYEFQHSTAIHVRIFSLLSKNESGRIKSPACLSVCPPLITFEPIGGFS